MRWDTHSVVARLRHKSKKFSEVKIWQLVIVLFLMTILTATFLRINNLGMIERRSAVIQADEKEDKTSLQKSLADLQTYVTHHMNTSLGDGFYLVKAYERDKAAAIEAAGADTNPNSQVYYDASIECRAKWQGGVASFRNDYVRCVIDRVSALSGQNNLSTELRLPDQSLYKVNFKSPLLSWDLAGLSVVVWFIIFLMLFWKIISRITLSFLVKKRYQRAE